MAEDIVSELERSLNQVANVIVQELESFEKQVYSDLEGKAPETTIETRIYWGSPDHIQVDYTEIEFNYKLYLKALLLEFASKGSSLPEKYRLGEEVEYQLFVERKGDIASLPSEQFWNDYIGSLRTRKGGGLVQKTGDLWVSSIPARRIEKMEEKIAQTLGEKSHFRVLAGFPEFLQSIMGDEISYDEFLANISHELTHLYVLERTDIKGKYLRGAGSEARSSLFKNATLETVEESFAYVSGRVISDYSFEIEGYSQPERLEWAINIVEEKMSEVDNSRIDWARKEAVKVLKEIGKKGVLGQNKERRDPLIYFIKFCLPSAEKRRLEKFKQIVEGDLSESYDELRRFVRKSKRFEKERNRRLFEEFKELEQEVDWENPREIEDLVLHQVLEKAVGKHDINWIHQEVSRAMEKEIENLSELVNVLQKIDQDVDSRELDAELRGTINDIATAEKELKACLESYN